MEEKKTDKMEQQPLFTRPEGGEEDEVTIDWMALIRRIFAIRRKLYLAAAVGLVAGVIIALSIPKQYTVSVTLSPKWAAARAGRTGKYGRLLSGNQYGKRQSGCPECDAGSRYCGFYPFPAGTF